MKFRRNFEGDAAEVFIGDESEDAIAGTDLPGGEVERGESPGGGEHLLGPETEAGGAGVTATIQIEGAVQLLLETAGIDVEVLGNMVEIVVLLIKEFEEEVLKLDVVVSVGKTEAAGVFECFAGGGIGFGDEGFEVNGHGGPLEVIGSLELKDGLRRVNLHGFGCRPTQPAELGGGGAFGTEFARGCLFFLQNQLDLEIEFVAGVEADQDCARG